MLAAAPRGSGAVLAGQRRAGQSRAAIPSGPGRDQPQNCVVSRWKREPGRRWRCAGDEGSAWWVLVVKELRKTVENSDLWGQKGQLLVGRLLPWRWGKRPG